MLAKRTVGISASEDRLASLIRQRLEPGADRDRIDQRIWDLFGEDWAIMFTDLSGFSRNVAKFGIIHFLQTIYESQRLLLPVIEDHDGILLKTEGDSFLVIFRRPHKALMAAIAMQEVLDDYDRDRPDEDKVLLCAGIGYGRVLRIGDTDVFGAEVNAASKLGEDMAKVGEILVTGSMRKAVEDLRTPGFERLDESPPGADEAFRVRFRA